MKKLTSIKKKLLVADVSLGSNIFTVAREAIILALTEEIDVQFTFNDKEITVKHSQIVDIVAGELDIKN